MSIAAPKIAKRSDPFVTEICKLLCNEKPITVPLHPEAGEARHCWHNVFAKVEKEGGEPVFGWIITIAKPVEYQATFHAVWKSPKGDLIDVTALPHEHMKDVTHLCFVEDRGYVFPGMYDEYGKPSAMPRPRNFPMSSPSIWPTIATLCREADTLYRDGKEDEANEKAQIVEDLIGEEFAARGMWVS